MAVKGSGARKRVRKVVADEESEDEEDDKMMEVDEEKPKAEETSAKPKASPQVRPHHTALDGRAYSQSVSHLAGLEMMAWQLGWGPPLRRGHAEY